jgi:choline dehydrogenase
MMVMMNVCRPHSRGEIRLRGADPELAPVIRHPLLGDARDVATLVRACREVERLFDTPPLREAVTGAFAPAAAPASDTEWAEYIRAKSVPCYHPVGSCRMGADRTAVVDPQLRVRGAQNLRVADASVMPFLLSANTNAATMMIAEKAADLIRAAH